jgi:hypothetical protein
VTATKTRNWVLREVADLKEGDLYLLNLNTYVRVAAHVSLDPRYRGRPVSLSSTKMDGTDKRYQHFAVGAVVHVAEDWKK